MGEGPREAASQCVPTLLPGGPGGGQALTDLDRYRPPGAAVSLSPAEGVRVRGARRWVAQRLGQAGRGSILLPRGGGGTEARTSGLTPHTLPPWAPREPAWTVLGYWWFLSFPTPLSPTRQVMNVPGPGHFRRCLLPFPSSAQRGGRFHTREGGSWP